MLEAQRELAEASSESDREEAREELEFNPFETTPGEIDALEGISEAAKKQAKEDIARLVMQAVERWKIT